MNEVAETDEREILTRGAADLGLALAPHQLTRMLAYLDLIEKWNRVHNLTAIRVRTQMMTHHLLDSLAIVPHLSGMRIIDVGTGAGLPGIPVAIACPARHITLIDSNQKKTAFLRQALTELPIGNAAVVNERAEAHRPVTTFDLVVSRAFAELRTFVEQARHLAVGGGRFVAMKGRHPAQEIEALPADIRVLNVIELKVPHLDAERHLILMDILPT